MKSSELKEHEVKERKGKEFKREQVVTIILVSRLKRDNSQRKGYILNEG